MHKPTFFMPPSPRAPQWVTAALLALAVVSLVFWVLRAGSMTRAETGLRFVATPATPASPERWGRALGATPAATSPAAPAAPSALVLAGVISAGQRNGMALIAVDGQKAQAFEPGQEVQPGRYLVGVGPRVARIGTGPQGPVTETLEMTPPALPSN
jgi:hypothetical protein